MKLAQNSNKNVNYPLLVTYVILPFVYKWNFFFLRSDESEIIKQKEVEGSTEFISTNAGRYYKMLLKNLFRGLPWWRSGWESACQCRGHGFEPWSGKIPHAVEQLGPWATAAEPARLEPVPRNGRGRDGERPAHRDEEWPPGRDDEWPPLAATRESPRTKRRPNTSKNK